VARPKTGDVIEIKTDYGVAYALYTHHDTDNGALLRVWNTRFPTRQHDLASLISQPESFSAFFPLAAAIKRGLVDIVSNVSVPSALNTFPTFRAGLVDREGKVRVWWLWDGEKEWRVGDLTMEQRKLPIVETLNDTALKLRIESDWTPEKDRR
jgi:hypothetical protein